MRGNSSLVADPPARLSFTCGLAGPSLYVTNTATSDCGWTKPATAAGPLMVNATAMSFAGIGRTPIADVLAANIGRRTIWPDAMLAAATSSSGTDASVEDSASDGAESTGTLWTLK